MAVGSGCEVYELLLSELAIVSKINKSAAKFPRARDLLELASFQWNDKNYIAAEKVQPIYLRNNVAEKPKTSGAVC